MLLERERELAALDEALARACDGQGTVLWLEGEAGAGKTKLLRALRERARARGVRELSARGGPLEQDYAWGIVRQLLEPAIAGDEAERARVTAGAAALALVVLGEVDAAAPDAGDAAGALHGLHWLVANLTDGAPLVLVVDDLQWADEPSLGWLAYLVRRAESLPLLLALATRPERSERAAAVLDVLADDPLTRHLRPRSLSASAVAVLAEEAFGEPPHPLFVAEVVRVTGGNPFYVGALLQAAREGGIEPHALRAARLGDLGPRGIARAVRGRIEALDAAGAAATRTAQALALLEEPAAPEVVAVAAGVAPLDVRRAADLLIDAGILERELPLDFAHPIVRTVVSDGIPLVDRPALNMRAAIALAATGADVERVAARLLQVPASATPPSELDLPLLLADAARAASARGVPASAAAYAARGLEADAAPELREQLLLARARALALLRRTGWEDEWRRAAQMVASPARRAQALLELVRLLASIADVDAAGALARETLADDALELDDDERAELEVGLLAHGLFDPERVEEAAPGIQALVDAELAGAPLRPAQRALAAFALLHWGIDGARAGALAEQLLAPDAPLTANPDGASLALLTLLLADRHAATIAICSALHAEAARVGSRIALVAGASGRGMARYLAGDLLAAEADAATVTELLAESPDSTQDPYDLTTIGHILSARGRAAEAADLYATRGPREPWPQLYPLVHARCGRAVVRLALGQQVEALADARAAGELAQRLRCGPVPEWRTVAARALLQLGRAEEAAALASEQVELARRARLPRPAGAALVALGLARGGGDGLELLAEAVATLEDCDALLELAAAVVEHGAALRRAGQRTAAVEQLRRGAALAERAGAVLVAAHAADELRVAGARPRRTLADGVEALTAAERRVIDVALEGRTNREIAQALFLTQKTVETHLSSAYRKLGIGSRGQLAAALATP